MSCPTGLRGPGPRGSRAGLSSMEMRLPGCSAGLPRDRRTARAPRSSGRWGKDRDRGLRSTRLPLTGLDRATSARRSAFGAPASLWPAGRSRAERWRRGLWCADRDAGPGFANSLRAGLGRTAETRRSAVGALSGTRLAGGGEVARAPCSGALHGCSAPAAFPAHSNRQSATRTQIVARTPRPGKASFSRPLPESAGCRSLL